MRKRSKAYKSKVELVEPHKKYTLSDALEVLDKMPAAKFDESTELTVRLGINVKHSDQQVRGTLILPHGVGKSTKVAVIAKGEKLAEAEKAGADYVGSEDLIEKIKGGWVEFDVLVTTPDMMKLVGVLGKVLGKKGLMPSPKTGTITLDVKKAVEEFRKGKVEYRADKQGIVHMSIGKKSFKKERLKDNILAVYDAILKAKPSSAKGVYIKGVYLAHTMSPGVEVDSMNMN
ncbi:MAG: 50S ribosomal protein L1 [Candidatus Margulisbacteria bacterium]|nr:50S ribosomal protein L1 [Candidatus Margulisiibacteriota bacterium]